jgi:hypothetical protein
LQGIEPGISFSEVGRIILCATNAHHDYLD